MRLHGGAVAIVFLWAGAGLQAPASAQTQEQLNWCSGDATGDLRISACTAVIQSGTNLAGAFYNRGAAYHGKDDYDRAIADYSEAIRLDPTIASGNAFYGRGNA
jgi:tetratricopeptide (TPR) repeat protein